MATSSNTFNSDTQPIKRRGKSAKTIMLDAIREEASIGLKESSSKDDAEKAFFKHVAKRAFNLEDPNSTACLKIMADKGWGNIKPVNDFVEFEFSEDAEPHIQAAQVMKAAAEGDLAPDVANMFIQSIKAMIDIAEYTDLKERIAKLEALVDGK